MAHVFGTVGKAPLGIPCILYPSDWFESRLLQFQLSFLLLLILAQVPGHQSPTWDTWMKSVAPPFRLAQSWLL